MNNRDYRLATLLSIAIGIFLVPPLVHLHEKALPIGLVLGIGIILGVVLFGNTAIILARFFGQNNPIIFTFVKFFITGVFNTTFDISIVNLLSFSFDTYSGIPLIIISTFSFFIILGFSYLINRSWSFSAEGVPSITEFKKFTIASLGSFFINTAVLYALTTITGAPKGIAEALWLNIVKLLTTVISMTWNFIAFRFFVFKQISKTLN